VEVQVFLDEELLADRVTLVGFVFVPPRTEIGQQLLACIDEFHYRFGPDVHFFFAGWSRHSGPDEKPPDAESIAAPDGRGPWLYSARFFSLMIDDIAKTSRYKWSGGPEILLVSVYRGAHRSTVIDFSRSIPLRIDVMLKDEAVPGIGQLLERIATEGRKCRDASIGHFSDVNGAKVAAESLMDGVLEALPMKIGSIFSRISDGRAITR